LRNGFRRDKGGRFEVAQSGSDKVVDNLDFGSFSCFRDEHIFFLKCKDMTLKRLRFGRDSARQKWPSQCRRFYSNEWQMPKMTKMTKMTKIKVSCLFKMIKFHPAEAGLAHFSHFKF
jgi:hypothetical protein